ncbi:MAG: protease complex subunit PrcB family protein [Longimicrobiaceae bacterium]
MHKELNAAVGQPVRCAVRRPEEWAALWSDITRNYVSPQPLPQVDFGTDMLLVAGMGIRTSTGYSIEIASVHATPGGLAATVVHHLPGNGCVAGMAETEPVHVVSVPRQDGPVRFIEKISYAPDCNE